MKVLKALTCSAAAAALIVAPSFAFADGNDDGGRPSPEHVSIGDFSNEAVMSWAVRVPLTVADSDAVYFALYTLENASDVDAMIEYFRAGEPISYAQLADLVETDEAGMPQAYAFDGAEWVEVDAPEGLRTVTFAYEAYPRSFEVAFPTKSWARLVEVAFDGELVPGSLANSREVAEEFASAFEALGNPTTPEAAAEFLARFDANIGMPVQIPAASEATGLHELSVEGMSTIVAYPQARPGTISGENRTAPDPEPSASQAPATASPAPSAAPSTQAPRVSADEPAQRTVVLPVTTPRPTTERPAVASNAASNAGTPVARSARTNAAVPSTSDSARAAASSEASKPALPVTGTFSKASEVAEAVGNALAGNSDSASEAEATVETSLVDSSSSARAATVALFACAGIGVVGAASFASIRRIR